MTLPGHALFYDGLVRARNVLSVFMHCFAIAALMSVLWLVAGYSIAFGGEGALWGGLGKLFLHGVTADNLTGSLPEILFFAYQITFAVITEPPRVYRRVICSTTKRPYRASSGLHRTPPLLLRAGCIRWGRGVGGCYTNPPILGSPIRPRASISTGRSG